MKKILPLILLLFISSQVHSSCLSTGIRIWPASGVINKKSVFSVEGFAFTQEFIKEIGRTNTAWLISDESKIKLKILKMNVSEFRLTQVLLEPEKELIAGRKYVLILKDRLNAVAFQSDQYNEEFPIIYTASNNADAEIPKWMVKPFIKQKWIHYFGCGPEKIVRFCAAYSDQSPALYHTFVKELRSGKINEYYLSQPFNHLDIGQNMCSGEFTFADGEEYEIQFALMDAFGNETSLTEPLEFTAPTSSDTADELNPKGCKCKNKITGPAIEKSNSIWFTAVIIFMVTAFSALIVIFSFNKRRRLKR